LKAKKRINTVKIFRGLNSYGEAVNLLNREARLNFELSETVSNAG
jgi:hypothetical protein